MNYSNNVQTLPIKFRPTAHKELKMYALENDMTVAQLIRIALIEYLEKRGDRERVSVTVDI